MEPGPAPIRIEDLPGATAYVTVGGSWATGLHQVDNPVFDADGNLFVTYSGSRGQESPVSIFRVTRAGTREPFVSGIVNATSMAIGPDGQLYVSSRFEGAVYRVTDRRLNTSSLCQSWVSRAVLAFDSEGDPVCRRPVGHDLPCSRWDQAEPFATLPASVAAFHLAISPEGELFASGPTLSTYDHVYRIGSDGNVRSVLATFGRPQGLAFSPVDGVFMSSMRLPVAADSIGWTISTASRNWSSPAAGSSASPSGRRASWRSSPTTPPTGSTPESPLVPTRFSPA